MLLMKLGEGHITREEGVALVDRYDQEFPEKILSLFLNISILVKIIFGKS